MHIILGTSIRQKFENIMQPMYLQNRNCVHIQMDFALKKYFTAMRKLACQTFNNVNNH